MLHVIDAVCPPLLVHDLIIGKTGSGKKPYDIYLDTKAEIDRLWPEARTLARHITEQVEKKSYALTAPLGLRNLPPDVRDVVFLALLDKIGRFTVHDDSKKVLWEIKSREGAPDAARKLTFSETAGRCPLHSDSAFAYEPEKYLCLYVVREASDGGGASVVVSVAEAIKELRDERDGETCLRLLQENIFPFRTPPAFSRSNRTLTAPVLSGTSTIRYRHDCIEDGFEDIPELDRDEHRWAVSYFSDFVEQRATKHAFFAETDQLVVVDNRRSLHARTNFTDAGRTLIRARLHAPSHGGAVAAA